jgi:hypothetical protein
MSKVSEVPAMLIAIDPAESQVQSSLLELAGKLHEALSWFAVHASIRPRMAWPGGKSRPASCKHPHLENGTIRLSPSSLD